MTRVSRRCSRRLVLSALVSRRRHRRRAGPEAATSRWKTNSNGCRRCVQPRLWCRVVDGAGVGWERLGVFVRSWSLASEPPVPCARPFPLWVADLAAQSHLNFSFTGTRIGCSAQRRQRKRRLGWRCVCPGPPNCTLMACCALSRPWRTKPPYRPHAACFRAARVCLLSPGPAPGASTSASPVAVVPDQR